MNIENFDELIAHFKRLKQKPQKFDMKSWLAHPRTQSCNTIAELKFCMAIAGVGDEPIDPFECRTIACIAGHVALIGGCPRDRSIFVFATEWLGLSEFEAGDLFFGVWSDKPMEKITLDDAIGQLETVRDLVA